MVNSTLIHCMNLVEIMHRTLQWNTALYFCPTFATHLTDLIRSDTVNLAWPDFSRSDLILVGQWDIKIKPNKTPHWAVDHLHSRLIYSLKLKELADSTDSAYYECPCYWKKKKRLLSLKKTFFHKKTRSELSKNFLIFMLVHLWNLIVKFSLKELY